MTKNFYLILFLLVLYPTVWLIYPQDNKYAKPETGKHDEARVVLTQIEKNITEGNVAGLAKSLSPLTYFSLSNGIRGYYSSNQAYYILEDFFKVYQVLSFKFHNIQAQDGNPYATGIYFYQLKGKRESAQVYVSLKNTGKSWKVIQITFN
jgi:hypothetical protein